MRTEALRVKNLHKSVGGVSLLEGVNFHIYPGELVGLLGLHDSGKTMLRQILSGEIRPDSGKILVDDVSVNFGSIAEAQQAGIFSVAAQSQLIHSMTVAENLFVVDGRNALRGAFSSRQHISRAREVLESFGLDIDPRTQLRRLDPVTQRVVEYIKIALRKPILIVSDGGDEFAMRDARVFEGLFKKLMGMGIAILTFSNKIDSVVFECDRVYPLREGVLGKSLSKAEYSYETLFRAMTGQELYLAQGENEAAEEKQQGEPVLEVQGLKTAAGEHSVDFRLHRGEILGLVIPEGDRARNLAYTLFGERKAERGAILLEGRPLRARSAAEAIEQGICMIPDRQTENGVFRSMSLQENISIFAMAGEKGSRGIFSRRMSDYIARNMAEYCGIPYESARRPIHRLRLRNADQLKVTMARWISMAQKVYILLNPFSGTDEQLAEEMIRYLRDLAARGAGVLIISAGPYRLRQVCDRIRLLDDRRIE